MGSGLPCLPAGDLPNPGIEPGFPALQAESSLAELPKGVSEVAQLCSTLCDPMDCSLPGFSVLGIFQARVLEWGAIAFSRGSS